MTDQVFERLEITSHSSGAFANQWRTTTGAAITSINPATGVPLGTITSAGVNDYEACIASAAAIQPRWAALPAPARGELVRQLGLALRSHKSDLGRLVTLETGKILSEGEGEVQEMIDMCDFATGLSRQLYGRVMPSERPEHRLMEQWHPLGTVGIITAFNFPVAVWAWNAALALVCGNSTIWKPSPKTPLTAIAVQRLLDRVLAPAGFSGVSSLCIDTDSQLGKQMASDPRLPLISATGSCAMGKSVAAAVGARLGRSLLELGGNNAAIVTPSANLSRAVRAILFAAVGTAGQRCTTLRRLFVHRSRVDGLIDTLRDAYASIRVGLPWDRDTLLGPLIDQKAVTEMLRAVAQAEREGATLVAGGRQLPGDGHFVEPTLLRVEQPIPVMRHETFAPILYVCPYDQLDEAIAYQNDVPQGLSSSLFTDSLTEAERFLSWRGSDCGIANINIGTSGAEIGGAFGGEKETGGGREAGSDSWKAYMRRQTCTVNWGDSLPLAQGVRFDLD